MTKELTVITDRVDDIPILVAHMSKMGLPSLLDESFPVLAKIEPGLDQRRRVGAYLVGGRPSAQPGPVVGGEAYVGDSKLLALDTRAFIQAGDDYYLGPLSKVHLPDEQLVEYLQPV